MNIRISAVALICLTSTIPVVGMKRLKNSAQLINIDSLKHNAPLLMNFKHNLKTFTQKKREFEATSDNSLQLVKKQNVYKGLDKKPIFKLYQGQKRYFGTTKMNQGPIGATVGALLGKAVVSVVGHGGIWLVSFAAGPAQPAAQIALESWLAIPIEALSMKAAIAGGILGGVATGPV